jgi:hypothetical protein
MIKTIIGRIILVITIVPFLVACVQGKASGLTPQKSDEGVSPADNPIQATSTALPTEAQGFPKSTLIPQPVFPGQVEAVGPALATPRAGEVPVELIEKMKDDLAKRLGIDLSGIQLVKAEAVTWNDGSLGCPQPEGVYTDALVNGYWVVLRVGAIQYDYRASETGYFILCEIPMRLIK